jgi:hypothetical protein
MACILFSCNRKFRRNSLLHEKALVANNVQLVERKSIMEEKKTEKKIQYMQDKEDAMVSKIEKIAEAFSNIETEELFQSLQALIDEDEEEK